VIFKIFIFSTKAFYFFKKAAKEIQVFPFCQPFEVAKITNFRSSLSVKGLFMIV